MRRTMLERQPQCRISWKPILGRECQYDGIWVEKSKHIDGEFKGLHPSTFSSVVFSESIHNDDTRTIKYDRYIVIHFLVRHLLFVLLWSIVVSPKLDVRVVDLLAGNITQLVDLPRKHPHHSKTNCKRIHMQQR
jgi:hypothetical protein